MNNKVKINYNETFGTTHSRDYYRGASFRWSGEWMVGAHYFSDDYNVDFVVHDQVILACAKSHMASLENEPKDFLFNENGDVIGVVSEYWDFVLSGVKGKTPGIKIEDNYWWTCSDITDPVWVNTGVKAKMELSDLTPEEIALLQEPGLEVVTHFIDDVITQSLGQDTEKVPSQKLITDELTNRVTKGEMSAAFINAKQTYDLTYQPIGDYATNTRVGQVESALDNAVDRISTNERNISSLSSDLSDEVSARQTEDATLLGKIQTEITDRQNGDYANAQDIAAINGKIPSAASSSNQLADKDYVHSEISTSSATFRGTYSTLEELQQQTADNNDYGFVVHTDALGNTVYSRYKYNGTSWIWEYDINSTEFTQTQWDAINSGINSSLVSKLSDLPTNSELTTSLNSKVDKTTKVNGHALSGDVTVTKGDVDLGNVDNTSDLDKPISTATQAALDTKVNEAGKQVKTDDTFVYRQTGGGLSINAKNARVDEFKGMSVVWNQLLSRQANSVNVFGATVTWNAEYTVSISGMASSTGGRTTWLSSVIRPINIVNGHKYLFYAPTSTYFSWFLTSYSNSSTWISPDANTIFTANKNIADALLGINISTANVEISASGKVLLIDLTLMFGAGNEPFTVAEFEKFYNKSYYSYNAGALINNNATALETVGFNQWDEETKIGALDANTGNDAYNANHRSSKNYIPCFPSTTYYYRTLLSSWASFRFYDANKQFLGSSTNLGVNINTTFNTPARARYMRFDIGTTNVPTDICINLSSSSNGQYEPYRKTVLPLNLDDIKVKSPNIWDEEWEIGNVDTDTGEKTSRNDRIRTKNYTAVTPNTNYYYRITNAVNLTARIFFYDNNYSYISYIDSIANVIFTTPANCKYIMFRVDAYYGTTYNNDICINESGWANGRYFPYGVLTFNGLNGIGNAYDYIEDGKVLHRKMKIVDMGTLNWVYNQWTGYKFVVNGLSPASKLGARMLCALYQNSLDVPYSSERPGLDKKIGICTSGDNYWGLYVIDSAYTDAATFKTAMSGVYLTYELAIEETYELAESIRTDYPVNKLGTERAIYFDTNTHAPFCADTEYHEANISDIQVEGITEYMKRIELTDELDKLSSIEEGAQVNKIEHIQINGTEQTISNKTVNLPAYPTTLPASDVYEWAKASTKPSYNLSEIGNADDVKAIENLSGTSGFLKKTAANSWSLDTNTYITARDLGEADLLTRINTLAYGIQWSKNSSTCTRIGNPLLHRTLPIQSQMKGCVEKNGEPVYWLNSSNWAYKANGDPSVLDGTDGYVRDYIPRFYGRSWDTEDYSRVMISTVKIDDTWVEIPEHFEDAYESALDRTNLKLCSVVNTSTQYRGGINSSTYDSYEAMRSLLGKPATNFSRANARTYASNAGSELLGYNIYKWVFLWLPVIEYANFDLQTAINNNLTAEGYHQGGLGNGATTFSPWSAYNGYNPIIPCGLTNSLGNLSGQVGIDYSAFDSYSAGTVYANRYRGLECPFGDVWTNLDGIIVDANHSDYDLVYTCNDPSKYSDSITSAYINTSRSIHTDGYVKEFDLGNTGEITAISVGGGKADYHYTGSVNSTLRTVLAGGHAYAGGGAGPGCLHSANGVSTSNANFGFRTIKRIY